MPRLPSWEAARPLASPQGPGPVFRSLDTAESWEGPTLCLLPTAGTSGIPKPWRAKLVLCLLEPGPGFLTWHLPVRKAAHSGTRGPWEDSWVLTPAALGWTLGPGTRTAFLPSDLLPSLEAGKFSSHSGLTSPWQLPGFQNLLPEGSGWELEREEPGWGEQKSQHPQQGQSHQ